MAPAGVALRAMLAAAGCSAGDGDDPVATDDFTDDDATPLTTHSPSWTYCAGTFEIHSNAVRTMTVSVDNLAGWNEDEFDDDQYAQGTIVSMQNYYFIGVAVRCDVDTPSQTGYVFYGTHNWSALWKLVDGVRTQLGDAADGFAADDVIRIEAEGTTIRALINDVVVVEVTDSDIASGAAGLSGWHYGAETLLDNWEGGNLGT